MKKENRIAYKGTNKDGKCRGFQFEVGKEYKQEGNIKLCASGFHACKNPLDVFQYYNPIDSRFFEVEQDGDKESDAQKTVSSTIKIKAEIKLEHLIQAGVKFIIDICKTTKTNFRRGNSSKLAASGSSSKLAASGYSSNLSASGDSSFLAASGDFSNLAASGSFSKLAASGDSSFLAASGNSSKLAASGSSSNLSASGNFSKLAASGDSSKVEVSGKESIACAIGINSKAKAKLGWIIIVDWRQDKENNWYINQICSSKIGGKIKGEKIQPDIWYWFEDGKLKSEREVDSL
jgi:hypothetical protein